MKRTRRCAAWILIVSLLLSFGTYNESYAAEEDSNDESSISVSFEDGTLTITGSGELRNPDNNVMSEWEPYRKTAKKIILDDRISVLGDEVFENFVSVEEISLPEHLIRIEERAFAGCSSLKKIVIPDEIEHIGERIAENCTSLEEIEIGSCRQTENVVYFGQGWFNGDNNIKKITVSEKNKYFFSEDNVLYRTERDDEKNISLVVYPKADLREEFYIPDYVTKVEWEAFKRANHLKKLAMSDSVKYLAGSCFSHMDELLEIQFSANVQSIYDQFSYCAKLEKIIAPNKPGFELGGWFGCDNINTIILPEKVMKFKVNALNDLAKLKQVVIYNAEIKIEGEPDRFTNHQTTFWGYKNSSIQKYVQAYEDDYNIEFKEWKTFPIRVSDEILTDFDVTVDDTKVTKADTEYQGVNIEMVRKSDSKADAIDINQDEICYIKDGSINILAEKPIEINKAYVRKEIRSKEEFFSIREEDTSHTIYSLENDIDLAGWTLPCYSYYAENEWEFSGVLEGNNHTITMENLNFPGLSDRYCGLCTTNNGIVRNCKLNYPGISMEQSFRGVCGDNYGTIDNCSISGMITTKNQCYGICQTNYGMIKNSLVDCEITACSNGVGIAYENNYILYNNTVRGSIQCLAEEDDFTAAAICHRNEYDAKMDGCVNYADLTGKRAVGIVYKNNGDVMNCKNNGTINGSEQQGDIIDGDTEQTTLIPKQVSEPEDPDSTPEPTETPEPTATPTPEPTATPTQPSASPKVSVEPTATPEQPATLEPTSTPTPSATPKVSVEPTATPTATPAVTPEPTATPRPTSTPNVTSFPTKTISPTLPISSPEPPMTTVSPTLAPILLPTQKQVKAVASVKVRKTNNNRAKITWKNMAMTYQIWRSKGSNHKYQLLTQISRQTSYVDTKVQGGKTYYYKIVAITEDGSVGNLETAKEVKVTMDWLRKPEIKVKNGKKGNNRYIEIKLSRYAGKYAQIQVKNNKKYRKISIGKKPVSSYKGKYRLRYKKSGLTLWFRVRTWKKMNGKKRYSAYSKPVKIKTA